MKNQKNLDRMTEVFLAIEMLFCKILINSILDLVIIEYNDDQSIALINIPG